MTKATLMEDSVESELAYSVRPHPFLSLLGPWQQASTDSVGAVTETSYLYPQAQNRERQRQRDRERELMGNDMSF